MTQTARTGSNSTKAAAGYWIGKRILIVSPEAWGPVRVSKHHYASTLMENGAHLFFLGPDSPTEHGIRIMAEETAQPALLFRTPPLRGMRFLPRAVRAWLEARQMKHLATAAGGPFDLLWNFDLHRFRSLTNRSHARERIVHVMDLREPAELFEPAGFADLVIVVSPSMAKGIENWEDRVLHLGHGWMQRERGTIELPSYSPGIKIAYLGNLAMRAIAWDSIIGIAKSFPDVQLHLIGPLHGAFGDTTSIAPSIEKQLRALPNIKLIGPVPYDQVPDRLEAMDILLIAYDLERVGLKATSSHKLLEYLASGKVVLSSYLEDHDDLAGLVVMARPGESVMPYVKELLCHLPAHNAPELEAKRKAYAEAHSYMQKVAQVAERLMAFDTDLPISNAKPHPNTSGSPRWNKG